MRGSRQHLWIYEDDGFAPLAQISLQQGETEHDAQVNWYHNDVSGLPRELTGADGSVVWRADYRAWGNTLRTEQAAVENTEPVYQPLRYQGQYFDAETGLHYNRFRYYDPDAGRFVSQDPIGLAGGVNLYQYAPNPLSWIDPLGLTKCSAGKDNSAHNAADYQKLKDYYTQHEKYGAGGVKKLQNGRYRFYDDIKPSRNPGEIKGARLVREWDPSTGNKRTWYETVDHAENIRSVAPKPVTHEKNHHIFDIDGNYKGRR